MEKSSPFYAEEEVFAIIDAKNFRMISLDFEKRQLASRCIVRYVDFVGKKIIESKAVTPKFKIKSTFAPDPYGESDITFLGGGFTASAVARKDRISLIASVPPIVFPDGREGLKIEVSMRNDRDRKSYNCLLTYSSRAENLHASFLDDLRGTIRIGDDKYVLDNGEHLQGRHIWKRTTFPKRKEKPIAVIYGEKDGKPFSLIAVTHDNSATIIHNDGASHFNDMKWETSGEKTVISNGKLVVSASIFASIHEKRGPFRKARTFRYASFDIKMGEKTSDYAFGYLEYPDKDS